MKTREEQLEAWKLKRTKPLTAISNTNIVNRPPKPSSKRLAVLNPGAEDQHSNAFSADKENQPNQQTGKASAANRTSSTSRLPRSKQALEAVKAAHSKPSCKEAHTSRKAALPGCTLENMENQYDLLKGTLDTLKRESIRFVSLATTSDGLQIITGTCCYAGCMICAGPASVAMSTRQIVLRFWDLTMLLALSQQADPHFQGQLGLYCGTAHS